jgi:hypothetical protein
VAVQGFTASLKIAQLMGGGKMAYYLQFIHF